MPAEGVVQEGSEVLERVQCATPLISAVQRVEHHEMAAYGCITAFAESLGQQMVATILEETLDEGRTPIASLRKAGNPTTPSRFGEAQAA